MLKLLVFYQDTGIRNWKLDPRDRFGLLAAFCRDGRNGMMHEQGSYHKV